MAARPRLPAAKAAGADLRADDETVKALHWENVQKKAVGGKQVQVETKSFEGLGDMHRAAVYVSVLPDNKAEFKRQEELYQAKQRDRRTSTCGSGRIRV